MPRVQIKDRCAALRRPYCGVGDLLTEAARKGFVLLVAQMLIAQKQYLVREQSLMQCCKSRVI